MRGYWTRPSVALANVEDASDPKADLMALGWELALFADENVTEDTGNLDPGVQVASWSNYAGSPANPHNFAQAVQGSQPTAEIVDGIQAVNFDGTADLLLSSGETWAAGTSHTIVIVFRQRTARTDYLVHFGSGLRLYVDASGKAGLYDGTFRATPETLCSSGAWHWLLWTLDGGSGVAQAYVDGQSCTPLGYTAITATGSASIGRHVAAAASYLNGAVAGAFTRPSVASPAEISVIATAINGLYGLSKGSL
jgi:hypothetical protein